MSVLNRDSGLIVACLLICDDCVNTVVEIRDYGGVTMLAEDLIIIEKDLHKAIKEVLVGVPWYLKKNIKVSVEVEVKVPQSCERINIEFPVGS